MELETIRTVWQSKKPVSYSQEELDSIYDIKKANSLTQLRNAFTTDLVMALVLTIVFIAILQVLNFDSSNFWSVCMAVLAIQHIVFYLIQHSLIKKYQAFEENVSFSIERSISRLRSLLWFYRIWPAFLSAGLYSFYINQFTPGWSTTTIALTGVVIILGVGVLANYISAVMIRKHIVQLQDIKEEYKGIS
ncbi:MAG: hypothetical protein ABFS32_03685 [Bacteroidota bacterium]